MRGLIWLIGAASAMALLVGCAMNGTERSQGPEAAGPAGRLLLDYASGTTGRAHCTVVDDPFGGSGKVIFGEVVEKGYNKTSFFNRNGFFVVPPEHRGEVVLRYAVRKTRQMRVALVSESGNLRSYYFEASGLGAWQEAVLPLGRLAGKVLPGEKIVDISIWQQGGGTEGGLWVDRAVFRAT